MKKKIVILIIICVLILILVVTLIFLNPSINAYVVEKISPKMTTKLIKISQNKLP